MLNATINAVPLAAASRLVPSRPNTATVWRWCTKGVRTRSGARVRLSYLKVGRRVFVRPEALEDFFAAAAREDVAGFAAEEDSDTLGRGRVRTPHKSARQPTGENVTAGARRGDPKS